MAKETFYPVEFTSLERGIALLIIRDHFRDKVITRPNNYFGRAQKAELDAIIAKLEAAEEYKVPKLDRLADAIVGIALITGTILFILILALFVYGLT